ncbi:MAG: hypothetical protein ACREHG_02425 [Candidatus Saccharimonadales bacterium]
MAHGEFLNFARAVIPVECRAVFPRAFKSAVGAGAADLERPTPLGPADVLQPVLGSLILQVRFTPCPLSRAAGKLATAGPVADAVLIVTPNG